MLLCFSNYHSTHAPPPGWGRGARGLKGLDFILAAGKQGPDRAESQTGVGLAGAGPGWKRDTDRLLEESDHSASSAPLKAWYWTTLVGLRR